MRKSYKIALSGITVALSIVLLTLAYFIPMGKLCFYTLSSMALLMPLSKKMYGYAVLTAVATALFSLLIGNVLLFVPYVLFFGIHPILTIVLRDIKLKKVIAVIIKQIYFNISIFLIYIIIKEFLAFPDYVIKYIYLFAIALNVALYIYDEFMLRLSKRVEYYVDRIKK